MKLYNKPINIIKVVEFIFDLYTLLRFIVQAMIKDALHATKSWIEHKNLQIFDKYNLCLKEDSSFTNSLNTDK